MCKSSQSNLQYIVAQGSVTPILHLKAEAWGHVLDLHWMQSIFSVGLSGGAGEALEGRCLELTTFQSEGEDGVVFVVEVGPDDSDVEETGVAMVGGAEDVGVVDACVEILLEGG